MNKLQIKKLMYICMILMCLVTFIVPMNVQAATVKLNATKKTIEVGKTAILKVKVTSKKVTWSSSDKKIATVSSKGKVKGIKAGTCTIKAKVGGKTYKCKVTVKKATTTPDYQKAIDVFEQELRKVGFKKPEEVFTAQDIADFGPTVGMGYGDCDILISNPIATAKEVVKEFEFEDYNLYYIEYQYTYKFGGVDYVRITLYSGSTEW